jgi:RIO kinase 1
VFKDRDRYVSGEYRFRHGYNKSNPRKMVKVWAEKEMRNLKRLHNAGIPCPEPLELRMHVLLMDFIGDAKGWPAPRLKDADIPDLENYRKIYLDLLKQMWILYQVCHLVHADLSEYNLLYHNDTLYMIDVSQSVEHDHPHALEFLRKDCENVVLYFRRLLGEQHVLTLRGLFDFVILKAEDMKTKLGLEKELSQHDLLDHYLCHLHEQQAKQPMNDYDIVQRQIQEEVFKQVYIPRGLHEIGYVEKEITKNEEVIYGNVMNITGNPLTSFLASIKKEDIQEISQEMEQCQIASDDPISSSGSVSNDSESDSESSSELFSSSKKILKKNQDKLSKKEHKMAVKEEKRLKRESKIPKAVKKRKEKQAKSKK